MGLVGDPKDMGPLNMGILWEAYHKVFPSLGVPGIHKTHTTDFHEPTK